MGQTFTAGKTGQLDRVQILTDSSLTYGPALVVEVQTVNASNSAPSGTVIGGGHGGDHLGDGSSWVEIHLLSPAAVKSGVKYALVFPPPGDYYYGVAVDPANSYLGGEEAFKWPPEIPEWETVLSQDLIFRTYVTPDTVAPTGTVKINEGATRTTTRNVTLALNATDTQPDSGVQSMRIKNAGGVWSEWQPYAESKGWKLTTGAGKKVVYVQYKDAAGNVSARVSDSITYRP
jgi:hypothetical protein